MDRRDACPTAQKRLSGISCQEMAALSACLACAYWIRAFWAKAALRSQLTALMSYCTDEDHKQRERDQAAEHVFQEPNFDRRQQTDPSIQELGYMERQTTEHQVRRYENQAALKFHVHDQRLAVEVDCPHSVQVSLVPIG